MKASLYSSHMKSFFLSKLSFFFKTFFSSNHIHRFCSTHLKYTPYALNTIDFNNCNTPYQTAVSHTTSSNLVSGNLAPLTHKPRSNLQKQQVTHSATKIKTPKRTTAKLNKSNKRKRLKQKRLKEKIYLAHFLALNNLHPSQIISGLDDGKEPDFTIILNGRTIGIELTTLPRLRERMSVKGLKWRHWFWTIKRATLIRNLLLRNVQAHYPNKTAPKNLTPQKQSNNQHYFYFQHSHFYSHFKQLINSLYKQKITLSSNTLSLAKTVATTIPPSQSYFVSPNKCQSKNTNKLTQLSLPLPTIQDHVNQQDINAVMLKKAPKYNAYQSRRQLDETWLLIHTNETHPHGNIAMPMHQLSHHSDYEAVWLTVFPKHSFYKITKN